MDDDEFAAWNRCMAQLIYWPGAAGTRSNVGPFFRPLNKAAPIAAGGIGPTSLSRSYVVCHKDKKTTRTPLLTEIPICQRVTYLADNFAEKVESMGRNTTEWFFFIKQTIRDSDDPFLRIFCYLEIEKHGTKEWITFLEESILNEENATALTSAYSALASIACIDINKARTMILGQPQAYRRSAAMIVLHHMQEVEATKVLIDIVNNEKDSNMRLSAAERLAYLGRMDGISELFNNLGSGFKRKVIAACALCHLKDPTGSDELHELLLSFSSLSQNHQTILISQLLFYFRESKIVIISKDNLTKESVLATALEISKNVFEK